MRNLKKIIFIIFLAIVFSASFYSFSQAVTTEEIRNLIVQIQNQILLAQEKLAQLQSEQTPPLWCYDFRINLKYGMQRAEVRALQTALEKEGFSVGQEKLTGYFGDNTWLAVVNFQEKYAREILWPWRLKYGTGFVGPATRTKLNQLYGCKVKPPPPAAKSISLLSPNGGENWHQGSTQNISWNSTGPISKVRIFACKVDGLCSEIVSETENDGNYSWVISPLFSSGSYRIKIEDKTEPSIADLSNSPFSISPPLAPKSITVLSPNGGENWPQGSTQNISWNSTGPISKVRIFACKVDGLCNEIFAETENDGSQSWLIPSNFPIGAYLIRIEDKTNSAISDESNSSFNILSSAKSLRVLVPAGGENWVLGSSNEIKWNSTGPVEKIRIFLCKINQPCLEIFPETENDGVQAWSIPNDFPPGSYKIKIEDKKDPSISAESKAPFNIGQLPPPPSITVSVPKGGEKWQQGSNQEIKWTAIGQISKVRIFACKVDGLCIEIFAETENDGVQAWSIPNDFPPGSYKIKIEDKKEPSVSGLSNKPFEISLPPVAPGNKYVFVTSQTFTGDMTRKIDDPAMGLELANKRCQDLAKAAGLSGQWRAWLSTTAKSAKENIDCRNDKSYWRLDGTRVANSCKDLTDGSLLVPITISEKKTSLPDKQVWTGTRPDGNYMGGDSATRSCLDWTDMSNTIRGYYGNNLYTSSAWTLKSVSSCSQSLHLYCFQL